LLRAAPGQDLFGEYSTIAQNFVAVGSQAQLKPQTRHSSRAWELARRTGSSRLDGEGAFADDGLIVQAAGPGQRWLPRGKLGAYLQALQEQDAERLLLLSQSPDAVSERAPGST
jgi:hypothetical protein